MDRLEKTSSCPDSSWLRLQQEEERGHVEECQDYVRKYCGSPDDITHFIQQPRLSPISSSETEWSRGSCLSRFSPEECIWQARVMLSRVMSRLKSELSVVFTVLDPCGNSRWMQELVGIRLSSGFPFHLYLTNMAPAINLDCKLVSELCMYGVGDAGSI